MYGFWGDDDDNDVCSIGTKIVLKNNDYLSIYGGTDAEIIKVYDKGKLYDIKCYNGNVITVSRQHFMTHDEHYNLNNKEKVCWCGAAHSKDFKGKHLPFCDLYKENKK